MQSIQISIKHKTHISIHTHTHTINSYSSFKIREEILSFATICMNLESMMLTEISEAQKNKYCKNLTHLELKTDLLDSRMVSTRG